MNNITNSLDTIDQDSIHNFNSSRDSFSPAPSEPIRASYHPPNIHREVSLPYNESPLDTAANENVGIGATNTIDIYLCIEDPNKKENESLEDDISIMSDVTQRHNKYMLSNKSQKEFYLAPYNKAQDTNWHIFDYNDIFSSKTSFLSDIFSNVIQPLIHSFNNGQSGCLALYSPDKTSWNDRLQLFDIVHQILLQLNIDRLNCKISAYEVNDDNAYDLLPIKASHSAAMQYNTTNILQFSRSKKNRAPLKLSLNRSLNYIFQNINKIGIKSIESGLQYFERSHNLFKSSKSSHYVYSITSGEASLRIVQLCTADPMRNQALLNMRQCIKVLQRNKSNQSKLKKSQYVPYRRHIFTKLFQEFIDGTSSFSFLFYLPSIHTQKIKETLYLDRILSLLNYSCKSKHVTKVAPVSQIPSSVVTPQNEGNPFSMSMLEDHNNRSNASLGDSLLQSAESTNIHMKTLLNKAYDELELSRTQTEKLLANKNETIQQLSSQVDAVRNECEKESETLRDEMKVLQEEKEKEEHKSKQYRKQINVLHKEIKVMNSSTAQIKFFLSEITKLLQIDMDKAQSLSWKDILRKVAEQKSQLDETNETIKSIEKAMREKDTVYDVDANQYKQQISQSQQMIDDQKEEIESLKKKQEEQTKQNELLNKQMEEMRHLHDNKMEVLSEDRKIKLNELHTALDDLSTGFSSLISSQENSPKKNENNPNIDALKGQIVKLEFQSVVHQQLTYKVQRIHEKLQKKVTKQKDTHRAKIAVLNAKCDELKLENDLFNDEIYKLNASMSIKQDEIEAITTSYKALLDQIPSIQDENKALYQKINGYKAAQKQLVTQHMLTKFQCVVYSQLNAALKKQIKGHQLDFKSHDKELQKLIKMKDITYDKLHGDYHELQKEFDVQLSIVNDLKNENIVKCLKEDKENLQVVNQKLKQQTNVYRFKSATHQKIAQTAKYQKHQLKSQVLQLLEKHAPNDEIKEILKESTSNHQQKIYTEASYANQLPAFDDIQTPKHKKIDSQLYEEQIQELQDTINSLQTNMSEQQRSIQKMTKREQEYNNEIKESAVKNGAMEHEIDALKSVMRDKDALYHSDEERYKQMIMNQNNNIESLQKEFDEQSKEMEEMRHLHKHKVNDITNDHNTELNKLKQIEAKYEKLETDTNHQQNMHKMKLEQERNKWIYKVDELKKELRDIMAAVRSTTKYIYQETKCEIRKAVKEYDGKYHITLVDIENENSKLKVEMKKQQLTNESLEEQVREKNNQMDKLHNELQCKHETIEQLQNDAKVEQNKLQQKHDMIMKQCLSISKINESMQLENNQLVDESIVYKETYQALQIEFVSAQHKYDKLSQYLFKRILVSSCYKHKCSELEAKVMQLRKDREYAQTNLTVEQLNMLELNDEVTELKQMNEAIQSNRTGLMLESMEANNTIQQLIEENNKLKIAVSEQMQAHYKCCNDPNHEQTIETLKRKFSEMCGKMDKLQIESLDYVQKAVALRDDNIALKKENRRKRRNIRNMKAELDELRSKDVDETHVNTQLTKTEINQYCIQFNSIQTNTIRSTTHSMDEISQKLNACVDKMKELRVTQTTNLQKDKYIKNIMLQMKDATDNMIHRMMQGLEEKCTLFNLRCNGISQNINLIKHALDTKQNEEKQLQLKNKHKMEKHLYDLQFATKVRVKAFKNEMIHNIKHSIECYANEYRETKSTISKTFELAIQRFNDSLKGKDAIIDELNSILSTKSSQFEVIHKSMDQYKSYKDDCKALKDEYDELKKLYLKLKPVESKYNDLQSANDRMTKTMMQQQRSIQEMTKREQEYNNEIKESAVKNDAMELEIDTLKSAMRDKDALYHSDEERYKQMIMDLNNNIESLQKEFDEQSKEMQEMCHLHKHKVSDIENDRNTELNKLKQIEAKYEKRIETMTDREHEKDSLHKQMTIDHNEKIKLLNKQFDEQSKEMEEMCHLHEIKVNDISKDHKQVQSQLESQICELKEYIKDIESKYDEIKRVKCTLEKEICDINEESQQLTEIELKYEDLQTEMCQAQELIKDSECIKRELHHEIKELMEKIEQLTQENGELKTEIIALKEQVTDKDAKLISHVEAQEKELVQLRNELEKTTKQRNKYYKDKQLLQNEMQSVSQQLDELNASKTHLVSQIDKLSEFHTHSAQVKQKMQQYSDLNTCTQQRVQQLELMKNTLEKDNTLQFEKMERVHAENESLKQEILCCDAQITRLKECILTKFTDLDTKYIAKVDTIQRLQQQITFKQNIIDELKENIMMRNNSTQLQRNEMKQKFNDLDEAYALKADQMERAKDRIRDLEYRLSVKNQRIQCLQSNVNEIKSKYEAEKIAINYKLETLQIVIVNKLNSVSNTIHSKQIEIHELSSTLDARSEELNKALHENERFEDENEMLAKYKFKLEAQVQELNRNLNTLHCKHRVLKQSLDKTSKMNQTMQSALKHTKDESFHFQKQLKLTMHKNEQIHKHRDHIKEKCVELESALKRYRDRFKNSVKECVVLGKKATVLEQLVRCSSNEIKELQFDKKSANVREKILSDLLENNEENALFKVHDIWTEIQSMETDNNPSNNPCYEVMQQRIDDIKSECTHYQEMMRLNDETIIDLKQQTAFSTHQILENWQKIFDKLVSMINIKSYTIEIMQKTVCDIMEASDKDLQQENQLLSKNLEDMKSDVRKLETKHRKEKIELQGLLDREVHLAHSQKDCMEKELNVYKSKLQKFYKKYHRSTEHKEHQKLAAFMDNMRHEMTQISQENVTMATVTNSLREIVREHQDKTQKYETQNEEMYEDIRGLCQYMQHISGETILSEDEGNMYNASNLSQMVSIVKQRALSISSSRSSLHNNNDDDNEESRSNDDEDYTIVNHNDTQKVKEKMELNECPLCEQEFNAMVWKYKCCSCEKHHCGICAPIRKKYKNQNKCRVCHQCYRP